MRSRYDAIGRSYVGHRRPDPRIGAAVRAALGDARTVVNVGAGTGSYEPTDRTVVAVEPAWTMLRQRGRRAAPAVSAVAEELPFATGSFDASLALLTHHHWSDVRAGFAELGRVAHRHVVLTWDPSAAVASDFWLTRDYFPALGDDLGSLPALDAVVDAFAGAAVQVVPIPHDCTDGFMGAYWRRPRAYLDAGVRGAISSFATRPDADLAPGLDRLAADLNDSGAWHDRNRALLAQDTLDLGYRLIVARNE